MKKLKDLVGQRVVILTYASKDPIEGVLTTVDEVQGWFEMKNDKYIITIRIKDVVMYKYEKPNLPLTGNLGTSSIA